MSARPAAKPDSRYAEPTFRRTALAPGIRYALRVDGPGGPTHAFDPEHLLLDPYARGLARTADGAWRSAVALALLHGLKQPPQRMRLSPTARSELRA